MSAGEATPTAGREQVLVDPVADRRLEEVGYVVVPLLPAAEVEHLRLRQAELAGQDGADLAIDFTAADRAAMQATADLLAPMWEAHLGELFVDHRVVVSTFIVKHPGPGSEMVMHHEPTFAMGDVPTYNAWIPLVDVSVERDNGVLRLVPGSEHLPHGLVGFNTPPLFRAYEHVFGEASIPVGAPAGSALVYDTRMLHRSDANLSDLPRPAIAAAVAPAGAPLVHVVATGRRRRQIYAVDPTFFVDVHPGSVVQDIERFGPPVAELDDPARLTPAEIADALGLAEVPAARTVVPGGLSIDHGHVIELVGHAVVGARLPVADVVLGATEVASAPPPWISIEGPASVVDLEGEAAAAALGTDLVAQLGSLATGNGRPAAMVIDPGGRAVLRVPDGGPLAVACLECPELRAGLVNGATAATFEPGVRLLLDETQPTHLWNEGPGPLWLVVTSDLPDLPEAPDSEAEAQAGSSASPPKRAWWRRWFRAPSS